MTWREKSVTIDEQNEYIFKSVLGDVTIDEKGVRRDELTGRKDWRIIKDTIGDDEIFKGFLPWEEVKEVSKQDNFLSYPHIDIEVEDDSDRDWEASRLMIFFKEDTPDNFDEIDRCFAAIKKMWNAYRQRNKLNSLNYSYQEETHRLAPPSGEEDSGGEEEDEEPGEEEPGETEDEEGEKQEDVDEQSDEGGGIESVIEKATKKPGELMDEFGG
ncbi:MAG: hypothetical protein SVU32_07315 [Candidatus Nanohaloarchaea archaeon]|nr:hypothetical protein [Candidatus Nanohaloarchaea archaeon]